MERAKLEMIGADDLDALRKYGEMTCVITDHSITGKAVLRINSKDGAGQIASIYTAKEIE
jgi:hypothetical protein